MKQTVCIFSAVLLSIVIFASCKNTTDMHSTGNESTTFAESTILTTTQFISKYGYNDDAQQVASNFLESLKTKDVEGFISLINWIYSEEVENDNIKAYSFISDIDVDSYKILKNETKKGTFNTFERFTVELQISKSSNELFPAGTSQWILDVETPANNFSVRLFREIDSKMNIITDETKNDIVKFCRDFSSEMNCYKTVTDFNTLVPVSDDDTDGYFGQGLIRFLPVTFNQNGAVSREELERVAKNVLGITSVDVTKDKYYDIKSDSVPLVFNTASWSTCSLASKKFDSQTKRYTIVIDYYSDTAYLLKAKTMQYNIRENKDNSFTLISTELLFDSGFEVASGLY